MVNSKMVLEQEEEEEKDSISVSSQDRGDLMILTLTPAVFSDSFLASELAVPRQRHHQHHRPSQCLVLLAPTTVQTADSLSWLSEQPLRNSKKRPAVHTSGLMASTQFHRRCSHCQVQKTPQWRNRFPLVPKLYGNACGVRYKSGRLFPEYRPACSPTFSSEVSLK
ncbi:hypothetical protein NC652_023887 [Populus alba x Populus x berolinensis]|nr:hypothetical protein NC652_023887 [Populus alba x Populus x berolinensis]